MSGSDKSTKCEDIHNCDISLYMYRSLFFSQLHTNIHKPNRKFFPLAICITPGSNPEMPVSELIGTY